MSVASQLDTTIVSLCNQNSTKAPPYLGLEIVHLKMEVMMSIILT